MADEPTMAPDEIQDTPEAPETEVESQDTPETDATSIDYEQQAADFHRIATQAQQEAAQYRQIIELAQAGDPQALEYLGWEAGDEDEEDYEDDDPNERIDQLEQQLQQRQQAEQFEQATTAYLADVNNGIEAIEQREGRTLTDEETQFVLSQTDAQLRAGYRPNVEQAFAPLENLSKTAVSRYLKSKKQAPLAPLGSAGDQKIDLNDDEARADYMRQIMEAESSEE